MAALGEADRRVKTGADGAAALAAAVAEACGAEKGKAAVRPSRAASALTRRESRLLYRAAALS